MMITVAELTRILHGFPRDAHVALAVVEHEKPPHKSQVVLFVEHGKGGTTIMSAPLDLSGLPSDTPGKN